MGGVKLILDESVDDGALADGLVANEDDLKLDCVLLVGSVANLVVVFTHTLTQIINYRKDTYSINRMDLYQMKYENIADRLKRLATSPNHNAAQNGNNGNGVPFRQQGNNHVTRRENLACEFEGRSKYQQSYKYSKTTMDTDHSVDQQSNPISTRNFLRENLSPSIKDRKINYERSTEYLSNLGREREQQQRMTSRREEVEQTGISNVKSESTLKMEEIMESFNNYKQNKEKFISSLGKYTHNRTETEPVAKSAKIELPVQPKEENQRIFNEIDNIWNDDKPFDQKVPQFQRSRKVNCRIDDLTDILNETVQSQENAEIRPKEFSRPKAFLKNIKTEQSVITEKPIMRTMISPRGLRAPGKICKNVTRQVISFAREGY